MDPMPDYDSTTDFDAQKWNPRLSVPRQQEMLPLFWGLSNLTGKITEGSGQPNDAPTPQIPPHTFHLTHRLTDCRGDNESQCDDYTGNRNARRRIVIFGNLMIEVKGGN